MPLAGSNPVTFNGGHPIGDFPLVIQQLYPLDDLRRARAGHYTEPTVAAGAADTDADAVGDTGAALSRRRIQGPKSRSDVESPGKRVFGADSRDDIYAGSGRTAAGDSGTGARTASRVATRHGRDPLHD